jgi:hypothetical protein
LFEVAEELLRAGGWVKAVEATVGTAIHEYAKVGGDGSEVGFPLGGEGGDPAGGAGGGVEGVELGGTVVAALEIESVAMIGRRVQRTGIDGFFPYLGAGGGIQGTGIDVVAGVGLLGEKYPAACGDERTQVLLGGVFPF